MNRCGSLTASTIGAGSWSRPRIIIYKAEITQGKTNPRFVVTNIRNRTPKFLYEKGLLRPRTHGKASSRITRPSCTPTGRPAIAFQPTNSVSSCTAPPTCLCTRSNRSVCKAPKWTTSQLRYDPTPRLKIGARVREHATRIRFHFPTSYPLKDLMKDDRPQPRHGVNAHTDGDVQKIDHQHDQGITSLKTKGSTA